MQCTIEPASVDLGTESSPVRVTIRAADPASGPMRLRSKRASSASAGYNLQMRAVSGNVVRSVDLPTTTK
jgi:hypothetical protein